MIVKPKSCASKLSLKQIMSMRRCETDNDMCEYTSLLHKIFLHFYLHGCQYLQVIPVQRGFGFGFCLLIPFRYITTHKKTQPPKKQKNTNKNQNHLDNNQQKEKQNVTFRSLGLSLEPNETFGQKDARNEAGRARRLGWWGSSLKFVAVYSDLSRRLGKSPKG